jgi:type I restriction enzyme R subunit
LTFDVEVLPKGPASKQSVDQLKRLEQELHERDEKLSALLADKTTLDVELARLREETESGESAI